MNSLIVHMMQYSLIFLIWHVAITGDDHFTLLRPASLNILCVRYIASLMMHLNVEKDVRTGISMMKYAVNHPEKFRNVHVGFFIGLLGTLAALSVEITVILVLVSLPNMLEVVMKYVSLAAIANIPRFYYGSLVEHKLLQCQGLKLEITNFRTHVPAGQVPPPDRPRPWDQKLMRLI